MITRRAILASFAGLLCATAGGCAAPLVVTRRPEMLEPGVQLFTIREALSKDLDGPLARLAGMGFRHIQASGLYGWTIAEFSAALRRMGLICRSLHCAGEANLGAKPNLADSLGEVIVMAHALGARDVVVPLFFMPTGMTMEPGGDVRKFIRGAAPRLRAEDYLRMADILNAKGRMLKREGLQLGYHNHNVEFAPLGDTCGLELLLNATDPALVHFELDVGWAATARIDVAQWLVKYSGRFTKLHVKNVDASTPRNYIMAQVPARLGDGVIDWADIMPLAIAHGARDIYVEEEAPHVRDVFDLLDEDYRYLTRLLGNLPVSIS